MADACEANRVPTDVWQSIMIKAEITNFLSHSIIDVSTQTRHFDRAISWYPDIRIIMKSYVVALIHAFNIAEQFFTNSKVMKKKVELEIDRRTCAWTNHGESALIQYRSVDTLYRMTGKKGTKSLGNQSAPEPNPIYSSVFSDFVFCSSTSICTVVELLQIFLFAWRAR